MRKIIAATFISLDGVMQAPGGPEEDTADGFAYGGWTFHYWDEAMGKVMDDVFKADFDLLLGRKTYEIFAAHWPHVANDPIADKFNAVAKYVATSSSEPLRWKNSHALRGDIAAELAKLKQTDGPNLLIQGSSDLIQSLLAHDLIDEFNLLIFPLILGSGKRLFGKGAAPHAMKLVRSSVSTTGVVMASYLRDGNIRTGSFALETPTDEELARREKHNREA